MAESLASRIGRILSGSLNALIDSMENAVPDVVMEQAMREIEGVIHDARAELGQTLSSRHLTSKRHAEISAHLNGLNEKIGFALSQNRDDLAEAAVSHQLDLEAQIPVLEKALRESSERQIELESYISALQAKKREMHKELSSYREAQKAMAIGPRADGAGSQEPGGKNDRQVERAESAFDRALQRIGSPALVKANTKDGAELAELEELAREHRIKERLAALKNKAS